jgi:Uma2 family endonuclease
MDMTTGQSGIGQQPLILHTQPIFEMSDELFCDFCQANRKWLIERNALGEVLIMPLAEGETSRGNVFLITALNTWALQDGVGVVFDSSGGFELPNTATRSPDATWVIRSRLVTLNPEQKKRFLPLCPNFVVGLRSPSGRVKTLQDKMQEYVDNGAQLGWLLDTPNRRVFIYRPGEAVECVENPATLVGDPELPGFVLDLTKIWEPDF